MQMNYENRVCCFIDILGFQNHIEDTLDEDKFAAIQKISSIISLIDSSTKIIDKGQDELATSKMISQFSDSIVISFKLEEPSQVFYILMDLLHLIINGIQKGFLLRGGVSCGKLIHSEKYLFGPALISAYKLESTKALYPRILVSQEVMDVGIKNKRHNSKFDEYKHLNELIKKDDDELIYIDFLEAAINEFDEPNYQRLDYIESFKKIINEAPSNHSVKKKIDWLKAKINAHILICKNYAKNKREIDDDPELASIYKELKLL